MTDRDIDSFNARADRYDTDLMGRRFHRPIQQAMVRIAASIEASPRAILDVGCGTGSVLALFSAQYPEAELCGVDPAVGMLRVARARLGNSPRVDLRNANAEALPFDDRSFELVVSSNSFHHCASQVAGFEEIDRVLAPGGHFILTDPFAVGWRKWGARIRPHGRMCTKSEVETMLAAAGLELLRWERVSIVGPLASYFVVAAAPDLASTTRAPLSMPG